ncbi:unnamed protein product [Phytophthora fragariaefolia]|uniref:Unnamed protein product n=1 Tax=Phytophthora fragariaefolia TaxID=1490495 RepID=A0A9W7CQ64_9STRA|nr:unnamed protein product [Phytophthora fragariaefolia]
MHAKASVRAREALAMSVIVEEPVSMRESRLREQEKHPDEIRPRDDHEPESPVAKSTSGLQSKSTSSSASTSASYSDDGYEQRNVSDRESRQLPGQESRSRRHSASTRHKQEYYRQQHSSRRSPPVNPERVPRSKSSHSVSSESEDESREHYRRPSRHPETSSSSTRPKASSIPPAVVTTRERVQRHRSTHRSATNSPSSSSDERNPSPRLEGMRSGAFHDGREHRRATSRHDPTVPSHSNNKMHPKSSSTIPPPSSTANPRRTRARPESSTSSPRDASRSNANPSSASHSDQERMHRQRQSRSNAPSTSREPPRATSSSKLKSLASPPVSDECDDRRLKAFRDISPPPRSRSTSNPKPVSQNQLGPRRQVASCRESKTMNPKLLSPPKNQRQGSSRQFLSSRDPSRFRSTSLLPKPSAKSVSSERSVPRSASASSLSSLASAPSPRASDPRTPLRLRHYEGRFSNRRGQTLFYFSLFPPEKMAMRGVVLCLHGIGDHCRRNVALYERLCREGFGVITYDLLNHGVSDLDQHKTRAHVSNFSHLVEDTNDFITFAKRSIYNDALRYWRKHHYPHHPHGRESSGDNLSVPQLPLIIAGTSFGSLIGLHTVLSGKHKFHAAVWGSPTVGVTWNPLLWAESKLARPLAAIIPTAKVVPAVQHDLLSRDPKFLKRFKADPLTSMDMMTTRTGHESLQAMIQLQEDQRVTDPSSAFCAVPTLFLAGSADGISDQQAAIKFFATMGNFDKEFKLFDGLFHMVYEEPEKESVFRYLAGWLHRRFPIESRQ